MEKEREWLQTERPVDGCSARAYDAFSLGKKVCPAYMPWEDHNSEHAISCTKRANVWKVFAGDSLSLHSHLCE